MKTYEITKIDKNVKIKHKCSECLVFKLFLTPVIQNINAETHLVLVDTCWPQELPVEHTEALINDKKYMELITKITRMPILYLSEYAVEAT